MAVQLKSVGLAFLAVSLAACAPTADDEPNAETAPATTAAVQRVSQFPDDIDGADPVWVVRNYLDQRLYGAAVPDYFYVCGGNSVWAPAGIDDGNPPPFANEQDGFLDIRTYDPATFEVQSARDPRYRVVTVETQGYERAEQRTFILGPQDGGYCIGELAP